jgi:predicted RNA binding protein YcfA (HicA-like mRNA interferase family)
MPTKFRDLEKTLRDAEFVFHHATGSHYTYEHPTRGKVTVPFHASNAEVGPGTLKAY